MTSRRPPPRKSGIGLPFIGGAVGVLAFALVFFFTASSPVAVVAGLVAALAMVIYVPIRRRRKRREREREARR